MSNNKTFNCERLKCQGMKYLACIRRQVATNKSGSGKSPKYGMCANECPEGAKRKEEHPALVLEAKQLLKAHARPGRPQKGGAAISEKQFETFYHKQPGSAAPAASSRKVAPGTPEVDASFRIIEAVPTFLSPEAADRLLEFNTYDAQRRPKERHLNELVKEMEAGLWRAAEVSVAVMPGGQEVLVNGQHSLMASIKAGREIFCFFAKYQVSGPMGLAALYMTFDLGRGARSIGDAVKAELHSLRLEWPLSIASMISSAAASIKHKSFRPAFGKAMQARFIGDYVKEGQFIVDMFRGKAFTYKHMKRAPVVRAMIESWGKYPGDSMEFWRLVRDGQTGSKKTPANMIRNYLLVLPSPWNQKTLYAKCIVAFNAFKAGHTLRGLEYDPEGPLPEVGE